MKQLREVDNDNAKKPEHLIEVTNQGQKTQMTREEVEALKERADIRVADKGDSATILHRLKG